jgi:hypothetical protein
MSAGDSTFSHCPGDVLATSRTDRIESALRRPNSALTASRICAPLTRPKTLIPTASANATVKAVSARGNNGRRAPNRHTNPNAPPSRRPQPRARL